MFGKEPNFIEKPEKDQIKQYKIGKSVELDIIGNSNCEYKENYLEMSKYAAHLMADKIKELNKTNKEKIVLGLAADTSPIGMYEEFSKIVKEENIDLKKVFVVRYEQGYGSLITKESDLNFDKFHEDIFFKANNLKLQNATIEDDNGEQKVIGNFLNMYQDYTNNKDQEKIDTVVNNFDNILKKIGPIDFAVLGVGKDGHIVDWGRFETGFKIRNTREKKPREYDEGYKRFEGDQSYRNYMWQDIKEIVRELYSKATDKEIDEGLKTTVTLGIKHIIGANYVIMIVPQESKKYTLKEAIYGSLSGNIKNDQGKNVGIINNDKKMRNPVGSVLKVRNVLKKPTKIIATPEASKLISLSKYE